MESLLTLVGMLFFMFLVLAAAVEVILEIFRGTLERFGVTWTKGKISLDEALKLAGEFAPNNTDLDTKLQAIKSTAKQIEKRTSDKIVILETIKQKLAAAGADVNVIACELNAVAASVKSELEMSERQRIFALRFIAAIIGCFLAYYANFYVFRILAMSPDAQAWLSTLDGLKREWINVLVGGLAAAAGSSYWHDKLDKIRNLKAATAEIEKLKA